MQILDDYVLIEPTPEATSMLRQGVFGLAVEPHYCYRVTLGGELRFILVPEVAIDWEARTLAIPKLGETEDTVNVMLPSLPTLVDDLTVENLLLPVDPEADPIEWYNPYLLGPTVVAKQDILNLEAGVEQAWEF